MTKHNLRMFAIASFFTAMLPLAHAQSVAGQIYGTVTDNTGAIISGATVQLTNQNSQQTQSYTTAANGSFQFIGIFPSTYNLKISHAGFKTSEQRNIIVNAQERVDLNEIKKDGKISAADCGFAGAVIDFS